MRPEGRGQVVVLAAVVVAVALVAMTTAYHGLSYRGDVRATAAIGTDDPVQRAEQQLQRDVDAVAVGPVRSWSERTERVNETRDALASASATLQRGGGGRHVVYTVRENSAVAEGWAETDCPGGDRRAFGPCVADGGIVVQERVNETVLVGVAVDLVVRTAHSDTRATVRIVAR